MYKQTYFNQIKLLDLPTYKDIYIVLQNKLFNFLKQKQCIYIYQLLDQLYDIPYISKLQNLT